MELEYQLSNGMWTNLREDRVPGIIAQILERETWYAPRVNRTAMTTAEEVYARLAQGEKLSYDSDWYANIRSKEFAAQQLAAAREAQRAEPMVQADCGHRIPRRALMNASLGSSCPECYDRMSN